jgi:hypothetical protein
LPAAKSGGTIERFLPKWKPVLVPLLLKIAGLEGDGHP